MAAYITTLSKFFIPLWIAFYTFFGFAVFMKEREVDRHVFYALQLFFMFLFHLSSFLMIYMQTQDPDYLFFYAFQQLTIFAFCVLFIMIYPNVNRLLLQNSCMLITIGFVILTRLDMNKATRQFVIVIISFVIVLFVPHIVEALACLKNITFIYAVLGIASLSIVLLLGSLTNGSRLSYTIFGVTFQPSEFVKIIFVFFIASSLFLTSDFKKIIITTAVAAGHVLLLVVSNDLGSALIFFIVYLFVLFLATRNYILLGLGIITGIVSSIVAYHLFSHIQVRVQAWSDPWSVINGQGYQIAQSLFAIGRGGLFGLGLFNGKASQIPYVEQDFIFSAIAEELGILFAFCLILICLSSFLMIMRLAIDIRDKFYKLLAFGLGILYIFQVFLTIGGDTKFIPLTGVTLPFVSYGGSSMLSMLIVFGVLEGIYLIYENEYQTRIQQRKEQQMERRKKKSEHLRQVKLNEK